MKKILFIIVLFLSSSIYYLGSNAVFGQEILQARERRCLQGAGGSGRPPEPVTLGLSGQGFPTGKTIDIEFCPPGGTQEKTQCSIVGSTTAQAGKVKTLVALKGLQTGVNYTFFGSWPHEELPMGTAETQQQGTLTFEQDAGKCISIRWDPYGRVFDSQSLEPIPNIRVSVLDKIDPDELTQTVNNPQTVKNDGAFNFLTEPGTYFLKVAAPSIYSFSATPNLHLNYAKAYSKRDGTSSIYKPNEPIIEKAGKPEHRDIPLDPGKNSPSHFLVINMPGNYEQMVFGNRTKYAGKISHPLSKVALVGEKTKKEVAKTTADKFGFWTILLDNTKIPQDEDLIIKLIKVDLTTTKADEKNARLTNDVTFAPILRTIQGYAYNTTGKIIPNATVEIVREGKNKMYYQSTADKDGYFSISTNNLPLTSYYVVLKTSNGATAERVPTSVFTTRNTSYLSENRINLMQTVMKNPVKENGKTGIPENGNNQENQENIATKAFNKQNILPLFIILVLLLGVAGTALFFFYSSKRTKRRK